MKVAGKRIKRKYQQWRHRAKEVNIMKEGYTLSNGEKVKEQLKTKRKMGT